MWVILIIYWYDIALKDLTKNILIYVEESFSEVYFSAVMD